MPSYSISMTRVCDDSQIYWLVIVTIDLPQPGFARERLIIRADTEQEALAVAGKIVGSVSPLCPRPCQTNTTASLERSSAPCSLARTVRLADVNRSVAASNRR